MKCPCQIRGQGSFCAHFHEFSLDHGPGFYCDGDIGQMNQAVLCFSTLLGLVVGATVASRYLLDLQYGGFWLTGFHYLGNLLSGSAKMAQDPQVGRTNALAICPSIMI